MDNVERVRVGFKGIGFALSDSSGTSNRLSDFLDKKTVILVFVPGIQWKYLNSFLKKWEDISYQTENLPGIILAVSSEHPTRTHQLKKQLGLRFPILWDESSKIVELYGVLNQNSVQKYPHPSVFLIDKQGIIRYKKVFVDLDELPDLDDFLQYLKK